MTRLEQLQKLVQIAPNDPMSHYGVGLEYINLENWDAAAAAFQSAIDADAKYSAAYYHKGRALINGGHEETARDVLIRGMVVAKNAGDWHTQGEMQALLDTVQ